MKEGGKKTSSFFVFCLKKRAANEFRFKKRWPSSGKRESKIVLLWQEFSVVFNLFKCWEKEMDMEPITYLFLLQEKVCLTLQNINFD